MKKLVILFVSILMFTAGNAQSKIPKTRKYGFTPRLETSPYLQMPTSNSMMIRWRTNENDVSFVRYGKNPDMLDKLAGNSSRTREHMVNITNLEPDTRYYYLIEGVRDTLKWDVDTHFTTFPAAKKKIAVGLFGDAGNNSDNQRKVRDAFTAYTKNKDVNAVIMLGDNAYSFGTDNEYQQNFFDIYKDDFLKKTPVFLIPGNHDYHDYITFAEHAQQSGLLAYYNRFTMPTKGELGGVASNTQSFYSFDIGSAHFIALDSYGLEDFKGTRVFDMDGRQAKWLIKDLEANQNKKWKIVLIHHPPYSMGSHNSDTETQLVKIRENLTPMFEKYGVDVVFSGHSHDYERSKLMKGHTGNNQSFNSSYFLSQSSGKDDKSPNSQPYDKRKSNDGTVYVVVGSSGALDHQQKTYPHNAMPFSTNELGGAALLEVDEKRLEMKWINSDGKVWDNFVIIK